MLTPKTLRRIKATERMRLWRKANPQRNKESWARYYYKNLRYKILKDKKCKLCEIPLITPVYGAVNTRKYCTSCSKNLLEKRRLNYRLKYHVKHGRI